MPYHNVQQLSDAVEALEIKAGTRKPDPGPQTEVQHAQSNLDAAIQRAKDKAGK